MNTLDFGTIMEQECWFEDYDLTCPICEGQGKRNSRTWKCKCEDEDCRHEWTVKIYETDDQELYEDGPDECPECVGDDLDVDEEDTDSEHCEHCTEGNFDVMWNTAYEVVLRYPANFAAARREAWEQGWCLIEHGNGHYLLSGGCGYDFTWKLHYIRWKLQDYLDMEDIRGFIRGGGHVFLADDEKKEFLRYCRAQIPTPREYAKSYRSEIDFIDGLLFPEHKKEVESDAHSHPVHV